MKHEKGTDRIGVGILVIGLLGTLMWACSIFSLPNHAFLSVDRLTYKISNSSYEVPVKVTDITKGTEKEPIYTLKIAGTNNAAAIPESLYMDYIGEGNNTIMVQKSSIDIIMAAAWFGTSDANGYSYTWDRVVYPWEGELIAFTEQDVIAASDAIVDTKGSPEMAEPERLFEYNWFSTGWVFGNDEENGYKQVNELTD